MSPCAIPLQPIHQVKAGRFELIPNEAQAEQPAAKGEHFVVRHHRLVGGGTLGDGLAAHCHAELDIGL